MRRLGIIAMNGMLEADIYGNVKLDARHGDEDHERNRRLGGLRPQRLRVHVPEPVDGHAAVRSRRSCRWFRHVDHTEHDTQVLVTEQGLADLRGLSPRRPRAPDRRQVCSPGVPATAPRLHRSRRRSTGAGQTPHSWARHSRSISGTSTRVRCAFRDARQCCRQ